MADFERSLLVTLGFEGQWSDHPQDKGGQTMRGIQQREYDRYCTEHGKSHGSVRDITDEDLRAIYFYGYWCPPRCDSFGWPLNLRVFDFAVNSGPVRAVITLQHLVGAKTDGKVGPKTLALVAAQDQAELCQAYLKARRAWFHQIVAANPSQQVFLCGWLKRVDQLEQVAAKL